MRMFELENEPFYVLGIYVFSDQPCYDRLDGNFRIVDSSIERYYELNSLALCESKCSKAVGSFQCSFFSFG